MNILIITGGNIDCDFALDFLKREKYECIIAVDGGLKFIDSIGQKPDHLVGDFDTIEKSILEKYIHREDIVIHRFNPEKDYTDTDIALKTAIGLIREEDKNCQQSSHIDIIGGLGTRMDHSIANIQALYTVHKVGIMARIIDAHNIIQMIEEKHTLYKNQTFGKYVSFLPVTQELEGITLKGFKYPLEDAAEHFGESLCISNELIDETGEIEIKKGIALMIQSKD